MALLKFDELKSKKAKKKIKKLTEDYDDKKEYFTEKLSLAVGTIAAAFYPKDVIVRMSDFPEFAKFYVDSGINSVSFNPDAVAKGIENIVAAEKK